MSSEAAILRGKGVISNPAFFMIIFLAGSMGLAGLLTIGVSGWIGWTLAAGTFALLGAGAAVAKFFGDMERLFIGLLAFIAALAWIGSTIVVFDLWWGHEMYVWAVGLIVFNIVLPVAAIMGERVLPLLIAFLAGAFGILSIVVFFMVVAGQGSTPH